MGSFRPPPEAAPLLPVPHALAVMPLDEGVDLEVMGVPLVESCAPMWPLALARTPVVVSLDFDGSLDEACSLVGQKPLAASELVPGFAEDDEEQVAALLEAALQRVSR
jgi:hypothetical protein